MHRILADFRIRKAGLYGVLPHSKTLIKGEAAIKSYV
jgi:hypothetical protein